jgi:hypothetical protein
MTENMNAYRIPVGYTAEKDHEEEEDIKGRIMLKWILGTFDEVLTTGLIWLRIGTSAGLL